MHPLNEVVDKSFLQVFLVIAVHGGVSQVQGFQERTLLLRSNKGFVDCISLTHSFVFVSKQQGLGNGCESLIIVERVLEVTNVGGR